MMQSKALLAAIGVALGGFVLMYLYMQRFEKETSGGAPVQIVVAASDIGIGDVVTDEMLAVGTLPEAYVEARHVRLEEVERVKNVRAVRSIEAGQAVLWSDVAATSDQRRDLSGLIRAGQRALTIDVDESGSFSGLLSPGDRVDVFLTMVRDIPTPTTINLLQGVMVLAVGRNMSANARTNAPTSVTVSVTIEQAQLLAFAESRGRLSLALRAVGEVGQRLHTPAVTLQDVMQEERLRRMQDTRSQTPPEMTSAGRPRGGATEVEHSGSRGSDEGH
jgi:pilus assembly protein CpaB